MSTLYTLKLKMWILPLKSRMKIKLKMWILPLKSRMKICTKREDGFIFEEY